MRSAIVITTLTQFGGQCYDDALEIVHSALKHGITRDDIAHANDDIDDFIAGIDPASMRDGRHIRKIAAARQAVEDAQENLRLAVGEAREAGDSWAMIGVALRTSKQNAFRKYGGH